MYWVLRAAWHEHRLTMTSLGVHLELVDAGGTARTLLRGDDVEPHEPATRGHRVVGHARGVAAYLYHGRETGPVGRDLDVEVAGVPGRTLPARTCVSHRERHDRPPSCRGCSRASSSAAASSSVSVAGR